MSNDSMKKLRSLLPLGIPFVLLYGIVTFPSISSSVVQFLQGGPWNVLILMSATVLSAIAIVFLYYNRSRDQLNQRASPECAIKAANDPKILINILETIDDLDASIVRYNYIGIFGLIFTVCSMATLGYLVFDLFKKTAVQVEGLDTTKWGLVALIYVLRTSLLGSFIVSFMIYAFKFTTASFDQAVRFTKRKHAALFMLEVVRHIEKFQESNIEVVMTAFKEWNLSVESAYTDTKFDAKMARYLFARLGKSEEAFYQAIKGSKG